jgi:gliding motility-associated-like protein
MLLKKIQFIFIGFIFSSAIRAQAPSFFNSNSQGGTNQFPFNNFSNARQVSWFFPAGNLGTLPPSVLITHVYLNFSSGGTATYPVFEIKLKTSTGTGMTGIAAGPVESGFTTALSANNYTLAAVSGQWKQFALQTPFYWSNTALPIIVQFQHNATSGTGLWLNQPLTLPGPGNARQWADFNGTVNTSVNSSLIDFGIDMIPLNITTSISCSGPGTATASVSGGGGPYSFTWMPGAQTTSVATGLFPGTYTINLYDQGLNRTYSFAIPFGSSIPLTGTVQSTGALACNGVNNGTAAIVLNGGSGNSIYSWTNGSFTSAASALSGLAAGNYSVTVTDALTACQLTRTFQIIQPPPQTLTVSAAPVTTCAGRTVTLSAIAGGGTPAYSYSWTGGPAAAQHTVSQSGGGVYTYSVTTTDGGNCTLNGTIAVNFIGLPQLTAPNVSICAGNASTLTVSGASTYTWLPGSQTGNTFTLNPAIPATYTVVATASTGCTTSTTTSVFVKPVPTASFSTFSITCANLGSATVFPSGGTGPYSYTWLPTAQNGPVAQSLNPNTYTVTIFDSGTGCTTNTTTSFTSLIPLSGSLMNSGTVSCNGGSNGIASFSNIAGGSATQNYLWTNGSTTLSSASPTNLTSGSWSVTVTDALTGCPIFSLFTISQPPALTLQITAGSPSACASGSVLLTGNNSGGTPAYSYSWANGPLTNTNVVSESIAGTYTYTLTSFDMNGCSVSSTAGINFIPNPVLTISDVSVCPLETGTLIISGATNYTWSNSSNNSFLADNPLATTVYSVTGEALLCTSTKTAAIILKSPPAPLIGSNSPVCNSSQLLLFANGGISYAWAGANGFNSSLQNPVINSVSSINAGIYNLTVTAANNCTAATQGSIVVNPTPTVSATGATVCTIESATLNASSPAGSSYQWRGPLQFSSVLQNPVLNTPGLAASGVYTVKVTSADGCTNSAFAQVSVVIPPSLTAQLSSHSLCSQAFNGSPNTITLTAGGASTYSLVTVPDMFNSNPNGPVSPLSAIPPNTGIASATLSGSNGVCTVTTALTFSIIPNPTVTVNNYTPVICAGQSFTYTNQGATSYTWSSATPGFTTYNNGGIAVANPSINSVFSVYGASLGCNSTSQTSSITVFPIPSLSVVPGNASLCIGSSTILTVAGTATTFTWQPLVGLNQQTGAQVLASPISNQEYTVTGSANNCTNTAAVTVAVLSLPQPVARAIPPAVCINETITLTGEGGEIYRWFGPDNLEYGGKTIQFMAAGWHNAEFTLTVTDKNGCKNSTSLPVVVNTLPNGSLLGSTMQGCIPFCSEFQFENASAASLMANWQVGRRSFSGKSFTCCFTEPGMQPITGKFKDNQTGCINTQTFMVVGLPAPTADFTWVPEKPIEGIEDVLFLNSSEGEKQESFNWYFIDNTGYKTENENTSYFFRDAGSYPVAFIVKNSYGCSDSIVKVISIEPDFNFYVPDAFTPNSDDRNDIFIPIVRGVKLYDLKIFNRWGDLIFHSADIARGWDGTFNAEVCKEDVYAWKATLSTIHGEAKEYTGRVTLMR